MVWSCGLHGVQVTGLLDQVQAVKPVFQEPRGAGDVFDRAVKAYYSSVAAGKGGLFMAVCRGKVSKRVRVWL